MKNQYNRIQKIVQEYFALVRKLMTGQGRVSERVLKKLKLDGKKIQGLIPRMARYGASLFPDGDAKKMAADLKRRVEAAQVRTDLALNNLQNKMLQAAQSALQNAAMAGAAMLGAAAFADAARALRDRRRDFSSDWTRTAKTEMHNAKEDGAGTALFAYPDGDNTRVWKRCQPTACVRCRAAYQNPDGTPRIFTIGELRQNGTNAGRKPAEWLPVIGCMHPFCQCTLELLLSGTLMQKLKEAER